MPSAALIPGASEVPTTVGRTLVHRLKSKFFLLDGTFISGACNFYEQVHPLFERAKQNAPSVLFIDDSDGLFENRGVHGAGLYRYLTMQGSCGRASMSLVHLTLATRDVRKAAAFFSAALGWHPIARANNIGRPAAWLEIAPGLELHLVEVASFAPSPFEAEFGRHIALAVPRAEFDDLKHHLVQQGATLIEPVRPTPFARFFFRNPDGYVFEVVEAERCPET